MSNGRMGIKRPRTLLILVALGLGAIGWGWAVSLQGFESSLLLEVGAGLFLFAFLLLLEAALERRIDEARSESDKAVQNVTDRLGEVEAVVEDVKQSVARLDEVGTLTKKAVQGRRDAIERALAEFDQDVSPATIVQLLKEAERVEAVDTDGVRVRIGRRHHRLRISRRGPPIVAALTGAPHATLTIEDFSGEPYHSIAWVTEEVAEVMAEIVERLQVLGIHGTDFDATEMLTRFRNTVKTALDAKTTFEGGPGDLSPVIEIPGSQWAITTWGLECLETYYPIEKERFAEEWAPHMAEKVWVNMEDFSEAYRVASAMYQREAEAEGD